MKKLKIYFDTSAIGYLDEHESPKEMLEMQQLWCSGNINAARIC
jgi:hypothetical protein